MDPSHVEDPGIASARSMLRVTKEFVEDFACARACKAVGGARLVSEMMRIISQRIAAYQGRSESSVGVRGENQGEAAYLALHTQILSIPSKHQRTRSILVHGEPYDSVCLLNAARVPDFLSGLDPSRKDIFT